MIGWGNFTTPHRSYEGIRHFVTGMRFVTVSWWGVRACLALSSG